MSLGRLIEEELTPALDSDFSRDAAPSNSIMRFVRRHFPSLRHLAIPLAVFASGFLVLILTNELMFTPRGLWWATRFAWHLGPWSRFPIPFDSSAFENSYFGADELSLVQIPLIATMLITIGLILSGLHACLFRIVLAAYRRFGWPPYLNDVGERLSRKHIWKSAVLRSWWVLPIFVFVHNVWCWILMGQSYAQSWIFQSEYLGFVLFVLAIVVYLRDIGRTIVCTVRTAVRPNEVRCIRCAYLLRGLSGSICPECGSKITTVLPPRFRLLRWRSSSGGLFTRIAWPVLLLAAIAIPAWEPAIFRALPQRLAWLIPRGSPVRWWKPHTAGYPVKPGTYCMMRRKNEAAVFWITPNKVPTSATRWWFWKKWDGWGKESPSDSGSFTISKDMTNKLSYGHYPASFRISEFNPFWWGSLYPYSPDWTIDIVPPESAPQQLRDLCSQAEAAK